MQALQTSGFYIAVKYRFLVQWFLAKDRSGLNPKSDFILKRTGSNVQRYHFTQEV